MPSSSVRATARINGKGRVAKRSGNACARCRSQKIKCSGSQPCEACKKRKLPCKFDERDQKILVTRGYDSMKTQAEKCRELRQRSRYIIDLQRQIESQRQSGDLSYTAPESFDTNKDANGENVADDGMSPPHIPDSAMMSGPQTPASEENIEREGQSSTAAVVVLEDELQSPQNPIGLDPVASTLTNPLSEEPSMFMTSGDGRSHYLGTSSNWSFSRRVLNMAHEYVHQSPIASDAILFDSAAYDLGWDGSRVALGLETSTLPSLDHAIYLINAVKFHCAQIFHLFDEEIFMGAINEFYANPTPKIAVADLDYIHLLLILAFGKALVDKNRGSKSPSGFDFFVRALQLLPDMHVLCKRPVVSAEILCCIALYLQSLDFRESAYAFIGQAMRVALLHGMHTNMPQHLGEQLVERCRRIWWTVYVMDREMTSLMGLPQSIHDDDVLCALPTFSGSVQRTSALAMQIRLSQTIVKINRGVYGADGRINKKFLISTKEVLSSIAGLADELRQKFPMQTDKVAINGVPRISGYLHLHYHQCIVLATRPLLLCFLKIRFESPDSYREALNSSRTVWNLIKMCMESSQQIVNILVCLKNQGLLETFLPFDLEPLYISAINLILGKSLDSRFLDNSTSWIGKSYEILSEIVRSGNLIAEFRKSELQQLEDILSRWPGVSPQQLPAATSSGKSVVPRPSTIVRDETLSARQDEGNSWPSSGTFVPDFDGFDWELTTAQIADMANSIVNSDTEWMQYAIMEHSI